MKGKLALVYLHVTFALKVRTHLAISEPLHANKLNGNKCAIRFRKPN